MAIEYSQVVVRRQRGVLTVQGMGQAPRGQKFIKASKAIKDKNMGDKEFKDDLASAVKDLYESPA